MTRRLGHAIFGQLQSLDRIHPGMKGTAAQPAFWDPDLDLAQTLI